MACAIHGSATCPEVPCPGHIHIPPTEGDNSRDESDAHAGAEPFITAESMARHMLRAPGSPYEGQDPPEHEVRHLTAELERSRDSPTFSDWEVALSEAHNELRSAPEHAPHVDVLDTLVEKIRARVRPPLPRMNFDESETPEPIDEGDAAIEVQHAQERAEADEAEAATLPTARVITE